MNITKGDSTKQVIVDGLLTSYDKTGTGSVILMLHGWGDSRGTFKQLSGALSKSHTVVTVDLPGFGGTATPTDVFDLHQYAQFVNSFLRKLSVNSIDIVVGHSNGGAIAIKAVALGLIQPKKLVLLASSGVRSTGGHRKKTLQVVAKAVKQPIKLLPATAQQKLKKRAYSAVGSDMLVAENMQETFKKVVNEDILNEAANVRIKTMLVYGSKDTSTPIKHGELLNTKIPNSKLIVIDDANHFLHQNNVSEVSNLIIKFIG